MSPSTHAGATARALVIGGLMLAVAALLSLLGARAAGRRRRARRVIVR